MYVRGFGLVLAACALILKFSYKFYLQKKNEFSAPQQAALEALFDAAATIQNILTPLRGN